MKILHSYVKSRCSLCKGEDELQLYIYKYGWTDEICCEGGLKSKLIDKNNLNKALKCAQIARHSRRKMR